MTRIGLRGYHHEQRALELFPRTCAHCGACWCPRRSARGGSGGWGAAARAPRRPARGCAGLAGLVQACRPRPHGRELRRDHRERCVCCEAGERHRRLVAPLVARSWRAVTPGQHEAPTPTTSPGDAREPRTARLPWTAPQWGPSTFPPTPTREGLRRQGVWGQSPHDPQQWPGSPAEAERHASATLSQRCRDTQPIAALTASWGERVFELAPHLFAPWGADGGGTGASAVRARVSPPPGGRKQSPGSPAACGGTPARRGTSAAVTGPRAAALTGRTLATERA